MGAKMIKALYQGKDWKEGNKKVAAHRHHTNSPNRRRRNKMDRLGRRGAKGNQLARQRHRQIAESVRFFKQKRKDKREMTPEQYREKYPRQTFQTNAMKDALIAAGIYGKEQRQEGQIA